jgi:TrmH RNA methyltransferase
VLHRARGVPCDEASDRDLERAARTVQHEGLVVEARPRAWIAPQELAERLAHVRGAAIALDRVRNSYNVGAILRTAAFFGLDGAVVGAPAPHPGLDPNAARVAEGGAEHLELARTTDLADTLRRMRAAGVKVVAADQNANDDARDFAFARPALVVLGNEKEGLSPRIRAECDATVAIRGAGPIESLNVGVAAGILIAQLARTMAP